MTRSAWLQSVVVLGCVGLLPCLCRAQPAPPITLDAVVAKLQDNLDSYERSIPSFLADEHINSIYKMPGGSLRDNETVAESVFRLKRDVDPERHIPVLDESREIKKIDGKPADGRDIDAPTMLSGAFSGGLALVSKDQQACMRYTLEPARPGKPIVVRFASAPAEQRPKHCFLTEDGSGRVTIDPTSMQITKIEIEVPHHVIAPRSRDGHINEPIIAFWQIQVSYKPVVLDARTFWLPATISSVSSPGNQVSWSFLASYRNYHLLQVSTRILVPTAGQ